MNDAKVHYNSDQPEQYKRMLTRRESSGIQINFEIRLEDIKIGMQYLSCQFDSLFYGSYGQLQHMGDFVMIEAFKMFDKGLVKFSFQYIEFRFACWWDAAVIHGLYWFTTII